MSERCPSCAKPLQTSLTSCACGWREVLKPLNLDVSDRLRTDEEFRREWYAMLAEDAAAPPQNS